MCFICALWLKPDYHVLTLLLHTCSHLPPNAVLSPTGEWDECYDCDDSSGHPWENALSNKPTFVDYCTYGRNYDFGTTLEHDGTLTITFDAVRIRAGMFYNCDKVKHIKYAGGSGSSLKYIGRS